MASSSLLLDLSSESNNNVQLNPMQALLMSAIQPNAFPLALAQASEQQEVEIDENLQEVMTCPICYHVFDEPKQLSCGHSLCATCINSLPQAEESYFTCPICRRLITETPVVNYALKSLVSRIKELEGMVENCSQCSASMKAVEQYCCDDCDHFLGVQRLCCLLCAMDRHMKFGHSVSKLDQVKKRLEAASRAVKSMDNWAKQCYEICKSTVNDRLNTVEQFFKLLNDQFAKYQKLEMTFKNCEFMSKNDIDSNLARSKQLFDIFERRTTQCSQAVEEFAVRMRALSQIMKSDLAKLEKEGLSAPIAHQPQETVLEDYLEPTSWFQYQRTGRVSPLQSALARRNAAIARRHPQISNTETGRNLNEFESSSLSSQFQIVRI